MTAKAGRKAPAEAMAFKDVSARNLLPDHRIRTRDGRAEAIRRRRLKVVRNPMAWSNYVLLMIFLLIFPLVSRWRRNAFEARRWSESDLGDGEDDGEAD